MSQLTPHLLLRAEPGASHVATVLRGAGYMVSKVNDDATLERISGAPHVDGVVIELPAIASIALVRRIEGLQRGGGAIVVISYATETVRRALPSVSVISPDEVDDDLVSTVDLALVAYTMQRTG